MRSGTTLVEMMVVIMLLGLIAGVAAVALRPGAPQAASPERDALAAARRRALVSGEPVTVVIPDSFGAARLATAYPDGSVVADSTLAVDVFAGRPDAPR